MNPSEFTQQHAPDGVLTSEQASQLLELAMEGDTGAGALDKRGPITGSHRPAWLARQ